MAFGLVLDSDVDLPGLPPARGRRADLQIRREAASAGPAARGPRRTIARDAAGRPWISLARAGPWRVLRVRGVGRFRVSARGTEVRCSPAPGAAPETFRRVLLDHVLPRALHVAGMPVLHGSAVAGPRGAVVFLGESGAGKSSLAALLAARGFALLADDGVRLEVRGDRVLAHPSHPVLRVRRPLLARLPEALRKTMVREPGRPPKWRRDACQAPMRFSRDEVAVRCIFVLTQSGTRGYDATARPLPPLEAALALLDATFRADPWDLRAFSRDLGLLGGVAGRVEVRPLISHQPLGWLRFRGIPGLPPI